MTGMPLIDGLCSDFLLKNVKFTRGMPVFWVFSPRFFQSERQNQWVNRKNTKYPLINTYFLIFSIKICTIIVRFLKFRKKSALTKDRPGDGSSANSNHFDDLKK